MSGRKHTVHETCDHKVFREVCVDSNTLAGLAKIVCCC